MYKQANDFEGSYVLSQSDGRSRGCKIALVAEGSYDQYRVDFDPDCETQFEFVILVSGWEPINEETIRIIGAEGSTMMDLMLNANGVYEGVSENDGRSYYIEKM